LQALLDQGKIALVDVGVQGTKALRTAGLDTLFIFIDPPSIETLEERRRGRGSESEQTLRRRMSAVQDTLRISQEGGLFDVTIVNEELDTDVAQVISFLLPSLRQKRCALSRAAKARRASSAVSSTSFLSSSPSSQQTRSILYM
jgi:guanylate kinase